VILQDSLHRLCRAYKVEKLLEFTNYYYYYLTTQYFLVPRPLKFNKNRYQLLYKNVCALQCELLKLLCSDSYGM